MPIGELLKARILKSDYYVSVGSGVIDADIDDLCCLLREATKVRSLDFSSTDFSDKSIKKLIVLLPKTQIIGLDLSSTEVTDKGVIEILNHWSLEFIDLSYNGSAITQATGCVLVQNPHLLRYKVSATALGRDFCLIARIDKTIKLNNERMRKAKQLSSTENVLVKPDEEIGTYKDLLAYLFAINKEGINHYIIRLLLAYFPSPAYLMAISRVSRRGKTLTSNIMLWNYYGFESCSEYINIRQIECVKQLEETTLIHDSPCASEAKTLFLDFYESDHNLKTFRFHFHCHQQIFIRRLCNEYGYPYNPYNRLGISWMTFKVDTYQVKFHMMNLARWPQIPERRKANIILSFPFTIEEIRKSERDISYHLRNRDDIALRPKLVLHLIDDRLAQQLKEKNEQDILKKILVISKTHALDVVKAIIRQYEQWIASLPREEQADTNHNHSINLHSLPREKRNNSCFK